MYGARQGVGAVAASFSMRHQGEFGTMTKPLHVGTSGATACSALIA